jgi:hypothetical protein
MSMTNDSNSTPEWMRVIGEVPASDNIGLGSDSSMIENPSAECYCPFGQGDFFADFSSGGKFIVRAAEDPLTMVPTVEQRI